MFDAHFDDRDHAQDEPIEADAQPVTADDVERLLTSQGMEPTLVRWADNGRVETVPGVLFSDISYSSYGRAHEVLATANDLRSQGDWDVENPTAEDFEAFAEQINQG